jgi:hypothetical protein
LDLGEKLADISGLAVNLGGALESAMQSMSAVMFDDAAQKFGLPRCMWVPIAARDLESIQTYVGSIVARRHRRSGEIGALKVKPYQKGIPADAKAPLWQSDQREEAARFLFPDFQVWVPVDYSAYKRAYLAFGLPAPRNGEFLDHVQNRRAIRLRWYSHPYVRLAPVSRMVNTSGGHNTGGEGMERAHLESLKNNPEAAAELRAFVESYRVQYADPMDLTKMLNIAPGTEVLPGVAKAMKLFYPA